jgi:hypothetical protein
MDAKPQVFHPLVIVSKKPVAQAEMPNKVKPRWITRAISSNSLLPDLFELIFELIMGYLRGNQIVQLKKPVRP